MTNAAHVPTSQFTMIDQTCDEPYVVQFEHIQDASEACVACDKALAGRVAARILDGVDSVMCLACLDLSVDACATRVIG